MLFSQPAFIFAFLPIALVVSYLASRLGAGVFLAAIAFCSLVFYSLNVPIYLLVILGSAAVNYLVAGVIADGRNRWTYRIGAAVNLACLGYFKYTDFALTTIDRMFGTDVPLINIVLPLGLSFITFEQIAFLSDVHTGKQPRGTALSYLAFITFFPKLIAGPIIRYRQLAPQMANKARLSSANLVTGLCIFSVGLFKKTVIADSLAPIVDALYHSVQEGTVISQADAAAAFLGYTFQIYFDFSGYSDMAIGLAWMFGFRLPLNFDSPYKSTSVIEFWRRWHITLSAFLRDYLYIPLGGNRVGKTRRYFNLFVVMILGGFWHGAGWTFILWGVFHGVALGANHAYREFKGRLPRSLGIFSWPPLASLLTAAVVVFAWNMFRAPSLGATLLATKSLLVNHGVASQIQWPVWVGLIACAIGCRFVPNAAQIFRYRQPPDWESIVPIPVPSMPIVVLSALAFCLGIIFAVSGEPVAFIYFQF